MEAKFWYCTNSFLNIWTRYGIVFSEKFCKYFADNVEAILYKEASLKPSHKVGLSVFPPDDILNMYEEGSISKIYTAISILPELKDNITFCWRSKSGTIVHTYDEEFDENDLECWIEGIKPKLYWDYLSRHVSDYPLKIKNLPFKMEVHGLATHLGLTIRLSDITNANAIIKKLGETVEKHNTTSEAKEREQGVVHNCQASVDNNQINFRIDLGSAGIPFVRKLLMALKKYPEVEKVIVDL